MLLFLLMTACEVKTPPQETPTVQLVVVPEAVAVELPKEPVWPSAPDADYPIIDDDDPQRTYLLEEPNRGPWLTEESAPVPAGLTTTRHAHCELLVPTLMCSPAVVEADGAAPWTVHRRGPVVLMAEREWLGDDTPATYRWVYDDTSRLLRLSTTDVRGELLTVTTFSDDEMFYRSRHRNGANALDGCGMWNLEDDFEQRIIAETCLSWSSAPRPGADGVITRLHSYDASGFLTQTQHTDANGRPAASYAGIAWIRYERDAVGRVARERYLGTDEQPVSSTRDGCAGRAFTYTPTGAVASETCLGTDDAPTLDASGVAQRRRTYHPDGSVEQVSHHDADGALVGDTDGVATVRFRVDARHRVVRRACLDATGDAVACEPGSAPVEELHYWNEPRGDHEVHYLTAAGEPSHDAEYRVARVRQLHDAFGRNTQTSCHDSDGALTPCADTGFALISKVYDDAGRHRLSTFQDHTGAVVSNMGTAERRFTYDPYDRLIEVHELGDGAEPVSFAVKKLLRDPSGRMTALLLFDSQHAPARYPHCFTGTRCPDRPWHAVRVVRADTGRVVENVFFDADGQRIDAFACAAQRCFE